jgi:hypothetical protein
MTDHSESNARPCSRRALLRQAALAVGGAAIVGPVAMTVPSQAAKMAQTVVGYQDSPKGAQECDNCSQFEAPSSCKIVDGTISPTGWCKIYVKKQAG